MKNEKYFCLKKKYFNINNQANIFLNSYNEIVELPINNHPGSFAFKRKNHIYEGIDFYCEKNDKVFAIEDGLIIDIKIFTGERVGSPWWNETQAILIRHNNFCLNYGEININKNLKIGNNIKKGQLLGNVKTILKKNKGRPMNMLHIEMYDKDTVKSISSWNLDEKKPNELLDPTNYFFKNFFEK